MQAQFKAGFLKDITADVADVAPTMSPTAVNAFTIDGKVIGVPFEMGEVAFYYNKKLFEKAGVKAEDIKTWDDFLGAVKKIKAAGITPIVVGAGEKWPMDFYYTTSSCASAAKARWPTPRPARTAASRAQPSSKPASGFTISAHSTRSSPVISRLRMPSRPASSATARRRWT